MSDSKRTPHEVGEHTTISFTVPIMLVIKPVSVRTTFTRDTITANVEAYEWSIS